MHHSESVATASESTGYLCLYLLGIRNTSRMSLSPNLASGQAIQNEHQIPIRLREQMAIEMAATGTAPSLTTAAQMVGVAPTTVMHRLKGRKNKEEEGHGRQKLTPEEERAVVDRCYFCCRLEFPPTIWQFRQIATTVLQKRNPNEVLGKRWE